MSTRKLIEETRLGLATEIKLPHQAAALGMNLYRLIYELGCEDDAVVASLISAFKTRLRDMGFENLVSHQMRYAIRLADSDGQLRYEELHKLLSLCDETFGLRKLGLAEEPDVRDVFESAVRRRLRVQRADAVLVAEDRITNSNRRRWWYQELVGAS